MKHTTLLSAWLSKTGAGFGSFEQDLLTGKFDTPVGTIDALFRESEIDTRLYVGTGISRIVGFYSGEPVMRTFNLSQGGRQLASIMFAGTGVRPYFGGLGIPVEPSIPLLFQVFDNTANDFEMTLTVEYDDGCSDNS